MRRSSSNRPPPPPPSKEHGLVMNLPGDRLERSTQSMCRLSLSCTRGLERMAKHLWNTRAVCPPTPAPRFRTPISSIYLQCGPCRAEFTEPAQHAPGRRCHSRLHHRRHHYCRSCCRRGQQHHVWSLGCVGRERAPDNRPLGSEGGGGGGSGRGLARRPSGSVRSRTRSGCGRRG